MCSESMVSSDFQTSLTATGIRYATLSTESRGCRAERGGPDFVLGSLEAPRTEARFALRLGKSSSACAGEEHHAEIGRLRKGSVRGARRRPRGAVVPEGRPRARRRGDWAREVWEDADSIVGAQVSQGAPTVYLRCRDRASKKQVSKLVERTTAGSKHAGVSSCWEIDFVRSSEENQVL